MQTKIIDQLIQQIFSGSVRNVINNFILERRTRGLSNCTIRFFQLELRYFIEYLDSVGVVMVGEITPDVIRYYLLALSKRRNGGGCNAAYRAIKSYLNWFEMEYEPEGWKTPIIKIKSPETKTQPLPGIPITDIQKMIDQCKTKQSQLSLFQIFN